MITLVEALNYRCLRYVHRPLKPFHVLVGPNASGKSTFLDVIGFLSDLVSGGLDRALSERSPDQSAATSFDVSRQGMHSWTIGSEKSGYQIRLHRVIARIRLLKSTAVGIGDDSIIKSGIGLRRFAEIADAPISKLSITCPCPPSTAEANSTGRDTMGGSYSRSFHQPTYDQLMSIVFAK